MDAHLIATGINIRTRPGCEASPKKENIGMYLASIRKTETIFAMYNSRGNGTAKQKQTKRI